MLARRPVLSVASANPALGPTRRIPRARRGAVLYWLPWIAGGGVKRRRLSLVRLLDPERYEQRMLIRRCKGKLVDQFRAACIGVTEVGNGALFDPRLMARSLRDAWRFQPDIVHGAVFEGVATAVVTRAAQRGRVSWRRRPRTRPTARAATTRCFAAWSLLSDVCVAISPKVGDYLAQEAKVPRAKVRVITNGVAKPEAPALSVAEVRQSFGLPWLAATLEQSQLHCFSMFRTPETYLLGVVSGKPDQFHGSFMFAAQIAIPRRIATGGKVL